MPPMPYSVEGKLVVAISSRALFDFEEENRVFERDGEQAYIALQYGRLDVPARHGVAFPLVKKLLAFNSPNAQRVEVVMRCFFQTSPSSCISATGFRRSLNTKGSAPCSRCRPARSSRSWRRCIAYRMREMRR